MNLTRCGAGHFYDEDKYASCPHCGQAPQPVNPTVALERNDSVTMALTQTSSDTGVPRDAGARVTPLNEAVRQAISSSGIASEDSPTIGYYGRAIGTEPVVGWLVCIQGEHRGEDFHLHTGRNFIGRAASMDVSISGDNSVAREKHAVVTYDPKGRSFMVQAGEAKELCYLNDKVVLSAEPLKVNDTIALGDTKLMFFPCCSESFNWEMVMGQEA
jgi:hypothetical protein